MRPLTGGVGGNEVDDGQRVVEHEGQWQGFETQISRYVDDKLAVIVLTNLAEAKPGRITHGVRASISRREPPGPTACQS